MRQNTNLIFSLKCLTSHSITAFSCKCNLLMRPRFMKAYQRISNVGNLHKGIKEFSCSNISNTLIPSTDVCLRRMKPQWSVYVHQQCFIYSNRLTTTNKTSPPLQIHFSAVCVVSFHRNSNREEMR